MGLADVVRVELADPPETGVTVPGERFALRCGEEVVAVSVTLPTNPLMLVNEIVDFTEPPGVRVKEDGLAKRLKSPLVEDFTVSETVVLCDRALLVAVIAME